MSQALLNTRLSSLDANFLYFEKKEAPLHIGSIHIYEGEIPFEAFVENMVAKLPLLPRYTQKVRPATLNLGHPTWENDPDFDIHKHVFRLQLPAPGTDAQLHALAEEVMLPMLDRSKALWELHMVYGLEGGRSAMLAKVHHAMIDGMSGIDLLKIILDISADPKPLPPIEAPAFYPAVNPTERFVESLLDSTEEGARSLFDFQKSLLNLAQSFLKESPGDLMQRFGQVAPAIMTPVSGLSFNKPPSGKQKLVWAEYYFSQARGIRAELGGTVNDVVLTVLTGAIARYVQSKGQKTAGRMLRIMAPVSMRQEGQRGALGNLVSMLPVEIPLDLSDPVERLHYVNAKTGTLKGAKVAESLNLFTTLLGVVPPSIMAVMGSLAYTPLPSFNIVCTNVPGPQIPLYSQGQRMISYYPYVPIAFAVGLSCAVVSYDQKIFFGITLDGEHEPEPYSLKEYLDQSFAELRQAAGLAPEVAKVVETPVKKTRARTSRPKEVQKPSGIPNRP